MKHTLSVLVENKPGVLTRVAGPLRPPGLQHRQPGGGRDRESRVSRMTITVDEQDNPVEQVTKQLHKLINVLKITDLDPARQRRAGAAADQGQSRRAALVRRSCRSWRSSGRRSST